MAPLVWTITKQTWLQKARTSNIAKKKELKVIMCEKGVEFTKPSSGNLLKNAKIKLMQTHCWVVEP